MKNPVASLLELLVRGYQEIVSPWFAPRCRYYPSCSTYALQSIRKHGALVGPVLAIWRVLRCNPWSRGGVDPVPDKGDLPWSRGHRRHQHETHSRHTPAG